MGHSDRKYSIVKNPEDVDGIVSLLREFALEAEWHHADFEHVHRLVSAMRGDPNSALLGLCKEGKIIGVIGGVIVPHPFNPKFRLMSEMAWYVRKEERNSMWSIRLMNEFEKECKIKGAHAIAMTLRSSLRAKELDSLYTRKGYTLQEQVYQRSIV